MIRDVLAETDARSRREAVLPEERDRLETGGSIECERSGLSDAGFENEAPNAKCPRLRFERSHEAPPDAFPTHKGRHIHPLEFGRFGIEEPQGAAPNRRCPSVYDEKGAAALSDFLGVQLKVVRPWLGIERSELGIQREDQAKTDLSG